MQYDTVLGKGAFKTVYKGFDEREGIEVAWNQVKSHDFIKEGQKLTQEINVLKNMKHKNVMCFYDSWIDEESGTVNFITELFTSGTLRQYVVLCRLQRPFADVPVCSYHWVALRAGIGRSTRTWARTL